MLRYEQTWHQFRLPWKKHGQGVGLMSFWEPNDTLWYTLSIISIGGIMKCSCILTWECFEIMRQHIWIYMKTQWNEASWYMIQSSLGSMGKQCHEVRCAHENPHGVWHIQLASISTWHENQCILILLKPSAFSYQAWEHCMRTNGSNYGSANQVLSMFILAVVMGTMSFMGAATWQNPWFSNGPMRVCIGTLTK